MTKEEENRINPSVTLECFKEIDRVIEEFGLFTGRTNFLISAIRSFIIECTTKFRGFLDQAKKSGKTPLETISLFEEAVMRYGDLMLDSYSEDFPGPNNKQIPIRPDETFRVLLVRFSYYLFGFRDEDATTKMCRAAIRWYIKEIKKAMEDADSFEDELMEIKNSVVKNRVDIGN